MVVGVEVGDLMVGMVVDLKIGICNGFDLCPLFNKSYHHLLDQISHLWVPVQIHLLPPTIY